MIVEVEQGVVVTRDSRTGRLLRFLFSPPPLSAETPKPGLFAARLAKSPPDVATRIGMERANAYYAAGCPVALCDHAAARDVWRSAFAIDEAANPA